MGGHLNFLSAGLKYNNALHCTDNEENSQSFKNEFAAVINVLKTK